MQDSRSLEVVPVLDFEQQYDSYLLNVRGLSRSTRSLHRHVIHKFLTSRFETGQIRWADLQFADFVQFLLAEFGRLHSRDTQRAWLMIVRSLLRYLADQSHILPGWDGALPSITNRRHARLPRGLSLEQVRALWVSSDGKGRLKLRERALLLLLLRLGLRCEEVASLRTEDIDWKNGYLKIRSAKTYRDRSLPLPQEIGQALVAHLQARRVHSPYVFHPRRPPFTEERCRNHVRNSMWYLFSRAGITDRGVHSLRHTAATEMVKRGASFKAVADVLGHRSITTTLIYAKLDLPALAQVSLPWPGGAR